MVQGIVNNRFYQIYNKTYKKKNMTCSIRQKYMKGFLCVKWKLAVCFSIVITGIFVLFGVVTYLNLGSSNICRKGLINVHLIPYLESTLDSSISLNNYIEHELPDIVGQVVQELQNDPSRRFTITEVYPLYRWWKNQTDIVQQTVRRLITEGRLEIAGSGWCVPDEALVHYNDFIDQLTFGSRCLEEIAGRQVAPDVSFLMDNKGHSRELATLLKIMDFKGLMLGGISSREQCYRRTHQKLDFLWSFSSILGIGNEKPNLLTSLLDERVIKFDNYFSHENPVIDITEFQKNVMYYSYGYSTDNVFIPIGRQFKSKNVNNTFHVIEALMNLTLLNSKNSLNIFYSTPSQYLNSLGYNSERSWRSFGEFLPYAESKLEYWTGYYSSIPSLKYFKKITSQFLQVFKHIASISEMKDIGPLRELKAAVSLSQHHKVATDVATQTTTDYFRRLLFESFSNSTYAINQALNKIIVKKGPSLDYESCLKLNVSECRISEENVNFILTIYNPSSQFVNHYVRIPITQNNYIVRDGDGSSVNIQIVKVSERILLTPGRISRATKELIFRAMKIPPLGFKSYYISVSNEPISIDIPNRKRISLVYDNSTGKISAIVRNGERYPITQEMMQYQSRLSWNSIFRPNKFPQSMTNYVATKELSRGELVTEYEQEFGSWAWQIVRIYKDEDFVEFKWIVGPIPIRILTENYVTTTFKTNIKNSNAFYTDYNGKAFDRKLTNSETDESVTEYIARNYRPLNSHIVISDSNYQFYVFNDRVQGGASLSEGQLEIMVHRSFLSFPFGNKNADLHETEGLVATGQHWVFIGSNKDKELTHSIAKFAQSHRQPWYFFANRDDLSFEDWRINHLTEFSILKQELPAKLRILTLEPWKNDRLLLRLENTQEEGPDCIKINLNELFQGFRVINVSQVTLIGNGFKEKNPSCRLFKSNADVKNEEGILVTNPEISILSTEIATYLLDIEH